MTGYNKVFLDTAPLIYFLDSDVNFGAKAKAVFEEILSNGKTISSSVITCTEYLVYPFRTGNQEKVDVFFEFTEACEIELVPITVEIAQKAAEIRARFKDFKAMDSLQLAAAIISGCDLFLTNDNQLKQFDELKCISLEQWS